MDIKEYIREMKGQEFRRWITKRVRGGEKPENQDDPFIKKYCKMFIKEELED